MKRILFLILALAIFLSGSALAKGTSEAAVELSLEEREWIEDHPIIRLSPDPNFLPLEHIDKSGNYVGVAADYVRLLEKKLNIHFNILKLKNWDEVIEKAKARETDMWGAATPTPQRLEYMLFTQPFIELPAVIIVRNKTQATLSLKELKGLKVAVISGYGIHDYLSLNHPEIKLDVVSDISTGLKKVSFGMVDAMIANIALATHYIEKDGIANLRVAGESGYIYKWGLASRNDWPELNTILQKGIDLIDEKEKIEMNRKWVGLKTAPSLTFKDFVVPVLSLLGLFAVIAIIISNRVLKKQVQKRTRDLQMILNSVGEGIYGLDLKGHTTFSNPAAQKMLGYSLEEMSGKNQHSLIHHTKSNGEPYPSQECPIYLPLKDGKTHYVSEEVFWRKDGTSFPVEYVSTPIIEDKITVGAVVAFRDISERKKDEVLLKQYSNSLERSNRELSSFASITSHDLKTPIRKIANFCVYIDDGESRLSDQAKKYLSKIDLAATHAADLIDGILSYSQLGEDNPPYNKIDLNETILKVKEYLEVEIREAKGQVEFNNLPCVYGNELQIEQLFGNLISNSLKYRREGVAPIIEITHSEKSENNLQLSVRDNGIGFKNIYAEKIFDPFQRLDGDISKLGSGLGLSICKKIMLAHDGDLVAEGEVGQGAKFILTFKKKIENE
jgi:PAS domain S-box-containing protein